MGTVRDSTGATMTQSAIVDVNGLWTLTNFSVRGLQPGMLTIEAEQTVNGTTVTTTHTLPYNAATTFLTLNRPIEGDNVVNMDQQSTVTIAGTTDLSDEVTISVTDGVSTITRVVPVVDGQFIGILDISSLQDGDVSVQVTDSDSQGFALTDSQTIRLITTPPFLTVDAPFGDYIVDADEVSAAVVSGRGTPGDSISVTITDANGQSITVSTTVPASGLWTVPVDVSSLSDGLLTVTTTATNANGNHATVVSGGMKDSRAPFVTIDPLTVSPVTTSTQTAVPVSGTAEAGSTVTVLVRDVNGQDLTLTTTTNSAGVWSVTVDMSSLVDGPIIISATSTDSAGESVMAVPRSTTLSRNSAIPSPSPSISMSSPRPTSAASASPSPSISVSSVRTVQPTATRSVVPSNIRIYTPIAGDNVANDEEDEAVLISGTAPAGMVVTVSVSDERTSVVTRVTVTSSGYWEVVLDISSLNEGELTVTATTVDGGAASADILHVSSGPTVTIDTPVASDNVIDRSEDTNVVLTGTAPAGATVNVTLVDSAGKSITKIVVASPAGIWTVPVDTSTLNNGEIDITASTTDKNGNKGSDIVQVLQTPYGTRLDCEDLPAAQCGNQVCDPSETLTSCPSDCTLSSCGDGVCGPMENSLICPRDCTACSALTSCGNTVCEEGENAGSCPADCAAVPPCGNGVCDPEENAGSCDDCALHGGDECGNGKCNDQENGGNCPQDCAGDNPLTCRNGICDAMENAGNCPEDCALATCNQDGVCDVTEHPLSCSDCSDLPEIVVRAYVDSNLNGVYDSSEELIEGAYLYVDLNQNVCLILWRSL